MKIPAVLLAVVIGSFTATLATAQDNLPRIELSQVQLSDAIRNLAGQCGFNYILDPRVPGSEFEPGRHASNPVVTVSWTNVSAGTALNDLLKSNGLALVPNEATTVTRIAPAGTKPDSCFVPTNAAVAFPRVAIEAVPLPDAIGNLAKGAGIVVTIDPKLSAELAAQGTVSFRWQQITARQALTALLDNHGLTLDPTTFQVTAKARK